MTVFPDRRLIGAVGGLVAAALAVAIVPGTWPMLAAAAGLLAVLVAWDWWLLGRRSPVTLRRILPGRGFVGRRIEVQVVVEYAGADAVSLMLLEDVPADLTDRDPELGPVTVGPGRPVTITYTVLPARRGDIACGPLLALVRSPLGFLRQRVVGAQADVLPVYPDTTRFLRPEALDPRRVLAAVGVRPQRRRGEGMEFESLREYVAGDNPRRIDWLASARRGRWVTRLYQHERNHTVVLALDTSRLMGGRVDGRTKLDHAVDAALALAYAALVSGDRVGLVVFDRVVRGTVAPRAHRHALGPFVEVLRTVSPQLVEADYRVLVRDLGVRQRQRALVVVLTDFVEADPTTLTAPLAVLAGRHEVMVVALRDRAYATLDAPLGAAAPSALYRRLVLEDLLSERARVLQALARQGVQTLDLPPEKVTPAVLNRYLAMRYGPAR